MLLSGNSKIADVAQHGFGLAGAGLKWWLSELAGVLPGRLTALFTGESERLLVRVSDNVVQVANANATLHWEFSLDDECDIPASLHLLLQDGVGTVLVFPAEMTLRRRIDLPLAAASELRAASSFLIDRVTPFRVEQAYYSTRLLSRDKPRKRLSVELVVAPRSTVDAAVAALARRHIPIAGVRVEGQALGLDFAATASARTRFRVRMQDAWKPVLAVGLLLMVGGPLGVAYHVHSSLHALALEVAAAEPLGQRAAALRAEVAARIAERAFLPARQRSPRAIEVLNALTEALPDDCWIFSLELRPNQVVVRGFASNVSELLERLTKAPFAAPELTAPVVHGATGKNRFELRVQVRDTMS